MQSIPSMASDTASTNSDEADLALSWSGRWTLGYRILALNLLTVALVALSTLYLDVFRNRLSKERTQQTRIETQTAAAALTQVSRDKWPSVLAEVSRATHDRMRLYDPDGRLLIDSWTVTGPTYELQDPSTQKWTKDVARALASTCWWAHDRWTSTLSPPSTGSRRGLRPRERGRGIVRLPKSATLRTSRR